jgi:glycosyltransferase involved in cell wall biosynthesis
VTQPKVSVVVPAYNVARYIGACLDSVCAQTLADWECIVVDDGSSDGTAQRVREKTDARIRLITQPNKGVSTARNLGLQAAAGRYVHFLDGDDLLHVEALGRLSSHLDAHPQVAAAYGTAWAIFEDGRSYPQKPLQRRRFRSGSLLAHMLRGENLLQMGTTMIRTGLARELAGFRTDLRLAEDWEFWYRVAAVGEFEFVAARPEILYCRMRVSSTSRLLSGTWENHRPALQAMISNPVVASRFKDAEWRRLTRQLLAFLLWECGRMNFTARRHAVARRLMLRSLAQHVTAKRLALFAIAQASELLNVSLVPRLRFLDEDACP